MKSRDKSGFRGLICLRWKPGFFVFLVFGYLFTKVVKPGFGNRVSTRLIIGECNHNHQLQLQQSSWDDFVPNIFENLPHLVVPAIF
jgi:hypothetical protein